MRKVLVYENNGKCPVELFFNETSEKIRNKLKYQLEYIENEHNLLVEPHIKHFTIEKYRQLYEIRIRVEGQMVRVMFYEHNNEIILLHAFYKKDQKDTDRALEISLKLLHSLINSSEDENILCRELII